MSKSGNLSFEINNASYIGRPISNTAMYISKKVEHLLINLKTVDNCLVFIEDNIDIPEIFKKNHCFISTKNPQLEYANYINNYSRERIQSNCKRKYNLHSAGYYKGENVRIGENCYIEPLCFIDHDVIIGDNVLIHSGSKIRNCIIGNNVIVNENAVIGSNGFTMVKDELGNNLRIPTIGKVIIGDNVEIGMLANISVGSAGNTIIEDYVKIDSFVHIAHDVIIGRNVEIPSGVIIGGFVEIGENVFIGINSSLRNRIKIGENAVIGMGSVVTKSIPSNTTVVGNPARIFDKTSNE